jgi:prolyl-tRNA editing enzyme YbaK/EbsC (Cys-tRNA(Pro) deacylase)
MVNSARWKWVPDNYYQQPLTKRAQLLGVPSTQYLCKSLVLENKRHNPNHGDARTNPQFVLVVLQYEATLDVRKLLCAIRALRPSQDRIDVSDFDWRVASTEDNDQLTGFAFNSVTPFGLLQPVPIVLADAIVPLGQFWMGGGHELLKLGMAVSDFIKATGAWVADVSQPRNADDDEFDLVDCK